MSDVVKSLLGRAAFQISWIFANAIVIGAASLALLPTAQQLGIAEVARSWDKVTSGLVLTATVVLAGFTMATVSTPLYRLLEGYYDGYHLGSITGASDGKRPRRCS